jgi:hypothetical protein
VTKDFYLGVDIAYQKLNTMTTSTGLMTGSAVIPATTNASATKTFADEDNWMVRFRVHRDFYP